MIRNLLNKPVIEKIIANWINDLTTISEKYNITIHHSTVSTKITPINASRKINEKTVKFILLDKNQEPKIKLGVSVRSEDIEKTFSKERCYNLVW